MIVLPHFDPVALSIGPLDIKWYGIMYLLGFSLAWLLAKRRLVTHAPSRVMNTTELSDFIFYAALGVLLGGRIGYVLFYNLPFYLSHPLRIFAIWQGGMSFHGGLLGVLIALAYYGKRTERRFFDLCDFAAPLVPLGLAAGRIGNFINGELMGRITQLPWGVIYPQGGPWPRHPSEIYEFLGEGVLLFILLWCFSARKPPRMAVSGLFLLGYGIIRFSLEFFRQPDQQIGFAAFGWMTRGQQLCLPMILIGTSLMYCAYRCSKETLCKST